MKRISVLAALFLFVLLFIVSCAGADEAEEMANGEEEHIAAEEPEEEEPALDIGEEPVRVIYGFDNRWEACISCDPSAAHPDQTLQQMSRAVAVLVRPYAVYKDEETGLVRLLGFSLAQRMRLLHGAPLCEHERFGAQLAPGICTGFMIDDQILVTAKHCVPTRAACEQIKFVFGFQVGEDGNPEPLEDKDIYSCGGFLDSQMGGENIYDFSIILLDRRVDFPFFELASSVDIIEDDPVAVIGHPSGLPKKISADGVVISFENESSYFVASLDTFAGSSGSPVIELNTYQVVGLLVGGEKDYERTASGCFEVKFCDESSEECSGEKVIKAGIIQRAISLIKP